MSSHREAPEISKDPVADSTDLYAFVSPDNPDTVTIIANYIPLEAAAGGPNFYEFGPDVLYEIHIDSTGDGYPNVSYQFRFTTTVGTPGTFLYNTGPISSLTDPNWSRKQTYSVTKVVGYPGMVAKELAASVPCPPCNIGPRSTPDYGSLAAAAITKLPTGETVFAGQRAEGFYVDLGSIFDLGDLRPLSGAHLIPGTGTPGVNPLTSSNVHTIAIQVPISELTANGSTPTDVADPNAVIGVWTSASRQKFRYIDPASGTGLSIGPWQQVSRLGNPLINEVIIPVGQKDLWNTLTPRADVQFKQYYLQPGLAALLPVLYPGAFPNLAAAVKAGVPRNDLVAVLLTGIPGGLVKGFQNVSAVGGKVVADELRLNVAIPPSTSPSIFGVVGGDLAGFPNGRRPMDDVVTIELQAVAGALLGLVDPKFKPDAVVSKVTDGVAPYPPAFQSSFPYLADPYDGFDHPPAK